ncbi:Ppx/GppA phosphatase family protein [Fodinicola feengrottensis]|uniref:Ppx/GppA phosphatase family protein n=1 Tax=Fodinicola feengrottensis TaxID=435914 RepID=A0ABP4TI08_9ACTN
MTRVAAIDCGTNSIRLLIADVESISAMGGLLSDVTRQMRIVRLGEGVDRSGMLAPAAIARTEAALRDYAGEIAASGAERVRMVATSASRDASNANEFTSMVRSVLGIDPEVISGDQEARLSFAGAIRDLPPTIGQPPYLIADIGGGSTELVLGVDTVTAAKSVNVGCVRLTERHLHDDPPTAAQIAAAEADVVAAIAEARQTVPFAQARTLIGLAGTVTTVVAIALGLDSYDSTRIHHATATYEQVDAVTRMLLAATRQERAALPVMHPGRVDVIGAGATVLRVLMSEVGAASVVASEHDILDGIAYSLA